MLRVITEPESDASVVVSCGLFKWAFMGLTIKLLRKFDFFGFHVSESLC